MAWQDVAADRLCEAALDAMRVDVTSERKRPRIQSIGTGFFLTFDYDADDVVVKLFQEASRLRADALDSEEG